jgi:hypothetical protein
MSIDDLVRHNNPFLAELARKIAMYKSDYESGSFTREEYESLCNQILNMEEISKRADQADTQQEIAEVVQFLSRFVRLI